jgi:hypothetical protein
VPQHRLPDAENLYTDECSLAASDSLCGIADHFAQRTRCKKKGGVMNTQTTAMIEPYTLVIIDMQDGFSASRDARIQKNILRRIDKAKREGQAVIVLQMVKRGDEDYGTTYEFIFNALADYDPNLWTVLDKSGVSGAAEIAKACRQLGFSTRRFMLAGVDSDQCVITTGFRLQQLFRGSGIQFIKNACNMEDIPPLGQWWWFEGTAQMIGFTDYELV